MKKKIVFCLHGFLGLPEDWDFLKDPSFETVAVDFMNVRGLTPDSSLERWGENFNLWVDKKYPHCEKHLIGYSMGGRLAMHALLSNFKNWSSAAFVSSHYGLTDEHEKQSRWQQDQRWSQKFLTYDFNTVIREWNAQPVFENSTNEPKREEKNYDVELLAKCLTNWSVSKQKYLLPELEKTKVPQLWMAGEYDKKYSALVSNLANHLIVPQSAHRLLGTPFPFHEYMRFGEFNRQKNPAIEQKDIL
jgi:2-succinyl-6-hydroxy-2,4-cyclohexadiene-1-carboxylate synthase